MKRLAKPAVRINGKTIFTAIAIHSDAYAAANPGENDNVEFGWEVDGEFITDGLSEYDQDVRRKVYAKNSR
jgi:hypothetical protein